MSVHCNRGSFAAIRHALLHYVPKKSICLWLPYSHSNQYILKKSNYSYTYIQTKRFTPVWKGHSDFQNKPIKSRKYKVKCDKMMRPTTFDLSLINSYEYFIILLLRVIAWINNSQMCVTATTRGKHKQMKMLHCSLVCWKQQSFLRLNWDTYWSCLDS